MEDLAVYLPSQAVKRTVQIQIAGASYRLSSDADEAHLAHLANTINTRIEALGPKAARAASPAQLLAVVALGLAEDLRSAEEEGQQVRSTTRAAVTAAIDRIDQRLQADALLAAEIEPTQ